MKAFPVMRSGHLHIGMWNRTSQIAVGAHTPLSQGFTHFWRWQALLEGQSELRTHSGRHPKYGSPWYSGRQTHSPLLHAAFAPHGDGLQGSRSCGGSVNGIRHNNCYSFFSVHVKKIIILLQITYIILKFTFCERISYVVIKTCANWYMVLDNTLCAYTARPRTGVFTFLIHTRLVTRTVCADRAFWTAVRWRSYIIG